MTRFLLVRHGQTPWNAEHRVQGLTDISLNETGIRQAELLAERLKGEEIHHFYSSHLSRAKQTGEIIAKHHPERPFEIIEDLAEFGMGPVEGMKIHEAHKQYTDKFWDSEKLRIELGMELRSTYHERFQKLISQWVRKHENETILLSSHGGKLATLLTAFAFAKEERKAMKGKYLVNCSLTEVHVDADGHRLALYGCDTHLIK